MVGNDVGGATCCRIGDRVTFAKRCWVGGTASGVSVAMLLGLRMWNKAGSSGGVSVASAKGGDAALVSIVLRVPVDDGRSSVAASIVCPILSGGDLFGSSKSRTSSWSVSNRSSVDFISVLSVRYNSSRESSRVLVWRSSC